MTNKTIIRGRVWKYGDNVNTDVIFPGKYTYTLSNPREMAAHALEDLDSDFASDVSPGDIVLGGENFGCGSSREQAAICLRECKVGAVVAKSFARIYFRNAINAGLPAIVCAELWDAAKSGDVVEIDSEEGCIRLDELVFSYSPLGGEVAKILEAGGLIEYTRLKLLDMENQNG